jgi:cytidylate kinase
MVARQREMGARGGVVMEGRDIGTKVFPKAEVKVFLDAAPEVRGRRRARQQPGAFSRRPKEALKELHARDLRDRSRSHSPLAPARDAVVLDTSALSLAQVVARVESLVAGRLSPVRSTRRPPGRSR